MLSPANRARRERTLDFVAAGLVVVVAGFMSVSPVRPNKLGDMDFYLEARAFSRVLHGEPARRPLKIAVAPGPDLYYTIPYLALRSDAREDDYWKISVFWNLAWTCVAAILLRRTGEALCRGGGWLALLLAFVPPLPVYYAFGVAGETPAFLGSTVFAYGWVRWLADGGVPRSSGAWWTSWLGLAILLLCRPNAVLVLPIGAAIAWGMWRSRGADRARGALIFQGLAVPIAAIALSMGIVGMLGRGWQQGHLIHVILQGRFQFRTEPWDWRFWETKHREGSRDHADFARLSADLTSEARRRAVPLRDLEMPWIARDVREHPLLSVRMVGTRALAANVVTVGSVSVRDFRLGPLRGPLPFYGFHALINLPHVGATILALVFLWRERRDLWRHWALWAPWAALLAFTAVTYVEPRYVFPGRPGIALMAACEIVRLVRGRDLAGARRLSPGVPL